MSRLFILIFPMFLIVLAAAEPAPPKLDDATKLRAESAATAYAAELAKQAPDADTLKTIGTVDADLDLAFTALDKGDPGTASDLFLAASKLMKDLTTAQRTALAKHYQATSDRLVALSRRLLTDNRLSPGDEAKPATATSVPDSAPAKP